MKKKIGLVLIFVFIIINIFIGINYVRNSYSISDTISEDFLVKNINSLNSILDSKKDTSNPYYISEILDDNGNVPAYEYYKTDALIPSRAINDLKVYDDKIFLGLGDYDANTGPVKIIYYDTVKNKIVSSGTIPDEEVLWFNIIDDKLYTTGADPRFDWGYGAYYIYNKETNLWDMNKFNDGWIHVYDIEKYNDKLFMGGSVTSGNSAIIQYSIDGGKTFEDAFIYKNGVKVPHNSNMRCYNLSSIDNDLYAFVYFSESTEEKFSGLYRYDEENNKFDNIPKRHPWNYPDYTHSTSAWFNWIHFKNYEYKGKFFTYGGYIYEMIKNEDKSLTFNRIMPDNIKGAIQDVIEVNNTLYLLTYQYNSSLSNFNLRIFSTEDLNQFNLVYETVVETVPFTIEYHNNNFYIGTGYYQQKKEKTGSLYKIDLDKFKNYLNIEKENKKINITKDGITNPVNYNTLYEETTFETELIFNNSMTKKEWEQEYTKFKNLNLLYSLVDNKQKLNYDYSISYFDNVISSNINLNNEYTSSIEFAKNIFSNLNIVDERFNINISDIKESNDEYRVSILLTIPNIDYIISEKYVVNEEDDYIYIGLDDNEDTIKSNLISSDLVDVSVDLENNKVVVKYKENIIKEYIIIRFTTDRKLVDKNIYMTNFNDAEALLKINVINGEKAILNNKLQIKYKDNVLDEYNIIRFTSEKIKVIDNKAYISNYSIEEIKKSINVSNGKALVYNDKIIITKDNINYDTLNIISINFGILKEEDKSVVIPERFTLESFINVFTTSSELNYKFIKDDEEILDGSLEENMLLKIYYNDFVIDTFNLVYEYLIFDDPIQVDYKYLYNVNFNTSVNELLNKINTSGLIIVKNKNNEIINYENLVGTGTIISIKFIGKTEEYALIIKGDLDGNGLLDMNDVLTIAKYIYGNNNNLDDIFVEAIDFDNNDIHNLEDIMKAAKTLTGGI